MTMFLEGPVMLYLGGNCYYQLGPSVGTSAFVFSGIYFAYFSRSGIGHSIFV